MGEDEQYNSMNDPDTEEEPSEFASNMASEANPSR